MAIFRLVSPLIYLIFLLGLILIFHQSLELTLRRSRRKSMLRLNENRSSYSGRVLLYMEDLLNAVAPESKVTPVMLLGGSSMLFGIVLVLLFPTLGVASALPAILFASSPVVFLRFRLEKLRNRGSREAEMMVSELLNCYRTGHKNIFEALEQFVAGSSRDCAITRGLIFQLLISIRNTRSDEKIRRATDRFAFALNTNWGYMLSACIFTAAHEGIDITESLEDIIAQLSTARSLNEEKKRSNTESMKIIQFLVPVSYIGSVLLGTRFMDVPLNSMLRNQFLDRFGIALFIFITGLFLFNMFLIGLIRNSKFDF